MLIEQQTVINPANIRDLCAITKHLDQQCMLAQAHPLMRNHLTHQSCKNFPGLLCAVNDQTVGFEKVWEQCYMWYPAANSSAKHSLSSLISMHAPPSCLSLYHSASNRKWGGSLRKRLHSLLSRYTLQEKLHTHTKYKSNPAAATYWAYKFNCKYGLFPTSPTAQNTIC